jgi:hypothetical protein
VKLKNNFSAESIDFTGVQRIEILGVNKNVKNKFGELKKILSSLHRKKQISCNSIIYISNQKAASVR